MPRGTTLDSKRDTGSDAIRSEVPPHVRGRRPHVVVIGAGFAGLNAAKILAKGPVDVTLIDRNNYHKFQPLLYQVATAGLEPSEIVHPVRDLFRKHENVSFHLGNVHAIDKEARRIHFNDGPSVSYDLLILAAGAYTNYFGIEGAEEHSLPMKDVPDALHLRNHILRQFEMCERDPSAQRDGALTFVIVGGGPTGVELAGQLIELFRFVLRGDFRRIDPGSARVVMLEMLPDLLAGFDQPLRDYARAELEKRGVEVRTETTVDRITADAVHLKSGERIPSETLIWAAGVRAHPLADALGTEQQKGGRLTVEPDLSVPGYPEIYIAGDMAAARDENGDLYAQLATVAIQEGKHAAEQILRRLANEKPKPFTLFDPGIMATIGRSSAVAQLRGGFRFTGFVAWTLWATIHIAKLVGFRNRFDTLLSWVYNYVTYDFGARLIMDVLPAAEESEPLKALEEQE